MARGGISNVGVSKGVAAAWGLEAQFDGPLFTKDVHKLLNDVGESVLPVLNEAWQTELEKRFVKGRGKRTGDLQGSIGGAYFQRNTLSAIADQVDPEVRRYAHRVEYGSKHMKAQNQRKNSRRFILRHLEQGGKYYKRFLEELTRAYNGRPLS